jgi:hypothetical protein
MDRMRIKYTYLPFMLLLGSTVLAQKHPDFSGVWVPQPLKTSAPANAGGSVGLPPSDITVRQTATELSISRTVFDIVNTQTYRLDGTESTNKSGAVTRITRSRWEGSRLIIEGKASQVTSAGYDAWTQKEIYSIDARGRLIIEREHVPSDGPPIKSTQEYTKRGPNIRRPAL